MLVARHTRTSSLSDNLPDLTIVTNQFSASLVHNRHSFAFSVSDARVVYDSPKGTITATFDPAPLAAGDPATDSVAIDAAYSQPHSERGY